HAIVGHTGAAWPVDHVHVADRVALAANERRQEPVQPVEIRQRHEQIAAERLEPAPGVTRAVAQHGAADRIGDARLELLEASVLAPNALAGDEAGARSSRLERSQEL